MGVWILGYLIVTFYLILFLDAEISRLTATNRKLKAGSLQSLHCKDQLESALEKLNLSEEKVKLLNARLEGENELRVERDAAYRDLVMEGPRFMELTERATEWKERCEAALRSPHKRTARAGAQGGKEAGRGERRSAQ
jgi:hypothetical protein